VPGICYAAGMNDPAPSKDHAGVRIPPPLIFLGALIIGVLIDRVWLGWSMFGGSPLRLLLAVPLFVAGVALIVVALGLFRRAGTRPEPWQPSSTLVADGIYRFTRNPMYLGMALTYAGLAFGLDSLIALLLLAPVVVAIQTYVIAREERYLEGKFGEMYREYKTRVRPWV
jgi:protein-S-isoprenylcysteine O-methyltransferase Ste14